ncbi:unnamed protein product [Adineta steineri]|uniref:F-box domain-containing protein n=1 Tax=Adineta steineri TaxID=433720 RepID=A0A819S0L9_9BILA|nr:unnamed protein product [Adineta steineri]
MEKSKRQRSTSLNNYSNQKRNKTEVTTDRLSIEIITDFEDLSNELIYEIFELLDFYHVYQAFYSLNTRFNNLITNSTLPIDINLSSISKSNFEQYNKDIILPSKHRIHSLHISSPCLYDHVSSPIRILSQFLHLKKLTLDNIESTYVESILPVLSSLPDLFSLSIDNVGYIQDETVLHQHIFSLSALTFCQLSWKRCSHYKLKSFIIKESSSIEHLIINGTISIDQFAWLLSYVPKLRRFHVNNVSHLIGHSEKTYSIILNNLTHVSLGLGLIHFDQFERMLTDIFHSVQVLHILIRFAVDEKYTNATQWQQLILSHMPNLRIFDIRHEHWPIHTTTTIFNNNDIHQVIFHVPIEQFRSSFWVERQWFFTQLYYEQRDSNRTIFHSTNPYRRKSYTLRGKLNDIMDPNAPAIHLKSVQDVQIQNEAELVNCKYFFPNVTTLTLENGFSNRYQSIATNLNRVLPLIHLTKLILDCRYLSLTNLIELLRFAPNVHTIKFNSLPRYKTDSKSIEENETFQLVSSTNIITNVTFRKRYGLDKLKVLMALYPRVQNLTVHICAQDLKAVVQFILEKRKENASKYLHSLCFIGGRKIWIKKINTLISSEALLDDYMLKTVDNNLYLWC